MILMWHKENRCHQYHVQRLWWQRWWITMLVTDYSDTSFVDNLLILWLDPSIMSQMYFKGKKRTSPRIKTNKMWHQYDNVSNIVVVSCSEKRIWHSKTIFYVKKTDLYEDCELSKIFLNPNRKETKHLT